MFTKIADCIINGVYESFKWHTFFIVTILGMFTTTPLTRLPLAISASILIMAFLVKEYMVKLPKWITYIVIGLVGIISGILVFPTLLERIFGCFYFGFLLYYVWYRHLDKAYFEDELKMSAVVIGVGGIVTIFAATGGYASNVNNSVLFYLFFVVFYLIRLHLLNEYDNAALSISKKRNMVIFDVALIVFAIVFVFLGKNALVYFPKLIIGFVYVVFVGIQYLWRFSYWLLLKIQGIYLMLTGYAQGGYEDPVYEVREPVLPWGDDESLVNWDNLMEYLPDPTDHPYAIMGVISYVFVFLSIILMIYFAFTFWPRPNHESNDVVAKSEKEFIFKPGDFLPKRLRKEKYISTTSKNDVRKAYVKRVNDYKEKQQMVMEPYMTPNEFLRITQGEHKDDDHSFRDLTYKYNEVRYKDGE